MQEGNKHHKNINPLPCSDLFPSPSTSAATLSCSASKFLAMMLPNAGEAIIFGGDRIHGGEAIKSGTDA